MSEYKRLTKSYKGAPLHTDMEVTDGDEIYERLAELEDKIEQGTLIEEKTCTNISENHPVDEFICSNCCFALVDFAEQRIDEENDDITHHEYEIKYCPNCGAKVVA